ncbi:MAG: DUF61 family protein [Methanocellales archaeon]|nr:DUF61 family protein [Methanocellales archaeon]MDI6903689.1 DUF61 family protein [Methanocellales archaeon]
MEKTFTKVVRSLNVHLPARRESLSTLLKEERPKVIGRNGSTHRFKNAELEQIAEIVPEKHHDRLKLPIYIELTPEFGRGAAKIHGRLHCDVVQSVLRMEREKTDELVIYRPEVRKLRRSLPTTTQYAFFYTPG